MAMLARFFLLFLLTLSGCDTFHGLSRDAIVPVMPEASKVMVLLQETPGIKEVEYRYHKGGRPVTLRGLKPAADVHTFVYKGESNVWAALQFQVGFNPDGEILYSHHSLSLNQRLPPEQLDATRPLMLAVEKRLEDQFGLTNLSSQTSGFGFPNQKKKLQRL